NWRYNIPIFSFRCDSHRALFAIDISMWLKTNPTKKNVLQHEFQGLPAGLTLYRHSFPCWFRLQYFAEDSFHALDAAFPGFVSCVRITALTHRIERIGMIVNILHGRGKLR